MDNRCVCCGEIIPEGRMVCPNCEAESELTKESLEGKEFEEIASTTGKTKIALKSNEDVVRCNYNVVFTIEF